MSYRVSGFREKNRGRPQTRFVSARIKPSSSPCSVTSLDELSSPWQFLFYPLHCPLHASGSKCSVVRYSQNWLYLQTEIYLKNTCSFSVNPVCVRCFWIKCCWKNVGMNIMQLSYVMSCNDRSVINRSIVWRNKAQVRQFERRSRTS
jgi:hypothetical protein